MAQQINQWLVFNIGCIECGVSSNIVGTYATEEEALRVAKLLNDKLDWREGGQNFFEVFDLFAEQSTDYSEVLNGPAA